MKFAYISVRQRAVGLLAGITLITAGVLVQTRLTTFMALFGTKTNVIAVFIFIIGAIVFTIGFFGCCGAYRRNYCIVMVFASFLSLVLALQVTAVVLAYFFKSEVEAYLTSSVHYSMLNYSTSRDVTIAWDHTHRQFLCCGATNYSDWELVGTSAGNGSAAVPESCCREDIDEMSREECSLPVPGTNITEQIYTDGCIPAVVDWFQSNSTFVAICATIFALIQVTGILLTFCLARSIKKEYNIS